MMGAVLPIALVDLLADVGARKRVWFELQKSIARKHAPDFNVFDFLRRDELGLSDIICWMLDSLASHGQGDTFLKAFCERFGISHEFGTDCVVAETEVATHAIAANQRRIDVHVRCGDFILAIENKPFAGWQSQQVGDYLAHLAKVAPGRHCLVLLKRERGDVPDSQLSAADAAELSAAGRLVDSDYATLEHWVRDCERLCEAPRVRMMLAEFADHLDIEFGRGRHVEENSFIIEPLLKQPERLAAALDLISANYELFEAIRKQLAEGVAAIVNPRGWKVSFGGARRSGLPEGHFEMDIDFGEYPVVFSYVAIWDSDIPYVGLRWKSKDRSSALADQELDGLNGLFAHRGKPETWWPWWARLSERDMGVRSVESLSDVWVAMNDYSAFAPKVAEWASRVHDVIRDCH